MVQVGDEKEDGEKPAFASLRKEQSIQSITLDDALELFKLPRTVGEYEDLVIKANVGRFGPYLQHGKAFISLKKEDDPMTVDLARAIEIIETKKIDDANKIIKVFPENQDVQLLNGRWGAYLKIGKDNFKLPKTAKAEELTLAECLEIAASQPVAKKGGFKKGAAAKKTTEAKPAVKKVAAKKPAAKKKVVAKKK
jgi:DNA topoisomerase-1